MKIRIIAGVLFLLSSCTLSSQDFPDKIRLNQIGFYPSAPKQAVVINGGEASDFYIVSNDLREKLFSGKLSNQRKSKFGNKTTRIADFTAFNKVGTFVLMVPNVGNSFPFEIKENVHQALAKGSLKGFYYQRLSIPLTEEFAGQWQRPAGHPDTQVLVHSSAATASRPEGFIISAPKGWYDAGDYNKYIVNSGISMGTLLSAYEDFPQYFDTLNLNIPESKNDVPDILDEILWNLRWMMAMQDEDGGVYNKLTNANFDGMILMPDKASNPRFVVQKSTAATLNFTAVLAQSARIYKPFEKEFPSLADSCLIMAQKAFSWALANPNMVYDQDKMNKIHQPIINTGGYGDYYFEDEFAWAAVELSISTNNPEYYNKVKVLKDGKLSLPSWSQSHLLAYYSMIRKGKDNKGIDGKDVEKAKQSVIQFADNLVDNYNNTAFNIVMGQSESDYIWGSNSVAANQSIAILQAYLITQNPKYLTASLSNLDYLLGRNVTGYSFVTGFGDKTPMHIHHRPSESDGIVEPVPGLMAAGPNPGMQDNCTYPSSVADEAYTDNVCSYASNEIAINWNAPLAYLVCAIEALQTTEYIKGE